MLHRIRAYIEQYQLLPAAPSLPDSCSDRPVIVALSGGPDSVALADILVRLGYPVVALHCNFHLRGDESDRDETFARTFARQTLGIPFYKVDFDTAAYATRRHLSIEMAARHLRYAWFEEMRRTLDARAIAVAHHRDDSVETLLMNLLRGSGIRGLCGIRPRNGYVVRPLLAVSREEIMEWLAVHDLPYVTDSTNLSDAYTRNFIRHRVLPLLEEINPAARVTLARSAAHLASVEPIYNSVIEQAGWRVMAGPCRLSIHELFAFPSPETVLYELLQPYGFTRTVASEVFRALRQISGKQFFSPTYRLIKDRDCLLLEPLHPVSEPDQAWMAEPAKKDRRENTPWQEAIIYPSVRISVPSSSSATASVPPVMEPSCAPSSASLPPSVKLSHTSPSAPSAPVPPPGAPFAVPADTRRAAARPPKDAIPGFPAAPRAEERYLINEKSPGLAWPFCLSCRKITLAEGETTFLSGKYPFRHDPGTAYFDYDKLRFPLCLRRWRTGDRFVPFGMTGRKKVSDYFTDRKFSRLQKENAWLLCSGEEIIWIVGERTDNRFRVREETKNMLVVNFFSQKVGSL